MSETVRTQLETISAIGAELQRQEVALLAAVIHQAVLDAQNGSISALRFLKSKRARSWASEVDNALSIPCLESLSIFIDSLAKRGYSL